MELVDRRVMFLMAGIRSGRVLFRRALSLGLLIEADRQVGLQRREERGWDHKDVGREKGETISTSIQGRKSPYIHFANLVLSIAIPPCSWTQHLARRPFLSCIFHEARDVSPSRRMIASGCIPPSKRGQRENDLTLFAIHSPRFRRGTYNSGGRPYNSEITGANCACVMSQSP